MTSKEFVVVLKDCVMSMNKDMQKQFNKLEKDLEVFEILKNKCVDILWLKVCVENNLSLSSYNKQCVVIAENEYKILKKWFKGVLLENE